MPRYLFLTLIVLILFLPLLLGNLKHNQKRSAEKQNFVVTEINILNEKSLQTPSPKNDVYSELTQQFDWVAWRANARKYVSARARFLGKNCGWGVGVSVDKEANVIMANSYYIPPTSIKLDESQAGWWLEANKPFYIYNSNDNNVYEAFYPISIKPTPENMQDIVKTANIGQKIFGIADAKKAYDNYDLIINPNDGHISDANRAFSLGCNSGCWTFNEETGCLKNKLNATQKEWACRLMDMEAETYFVKRDVAAHRQDFVFPASEQIPYVFVADVYLCGSTQELYND